MACWPDGLRGGNREKQQRTPVAAHFSTMYLSFPGFLIPVSSPCQTKAREARKVRKHVQVEYKVFNAYFIDWGFSRDPLRLAHVRAVAASTRSLARSDQRHENMK